jgi:hypothetical protein
MRDGSSVDGLESVPDEHLASVIGVAEGFGEVDTDWQRCSLRSSAERTAESNRVTPFGWWVPALFFVAAGLS